MTELKLRAIQAGVNVDAINDFLDALITNHMEYCRDSEESLTLVNFRDIYSAMGMDLSAREINFYRIAVGKYLRDMWTLEYAKHYVYRRTLGMLEV